jgi:hypothetical protein
VDYTDENTKEYFETIRLPGREDVVVIFLLILGENYEVLV